jgi:hypothetical protein
MGGNGYETNSCLGADPIFSLRRARSSNLGIPIPGPHHPHGDRSPIPRSEVRSPWSRSDIELVEPTLLPPYQLVKARLSSSSKVGNAFTAAHMQEHVEKLQIPTSTLEEFEHLLSLPNKGK